MFNFDITSILVNAIISSVILFLVGILTKRKFGFEVGKAISFIKMSFIVFVHFLVFWLTHQTPDLQALLDYLDFLPGYIINFIGALMGLIVGDAVGSFLHHAYEFS